jgi:hypothetical protein
MFVLRNSPSFKRSRCGMNFPLFSARSRFLNRWRFGWFCGVALLHFVPGIIRGAEFREDRNVFSAPPAPYSPRLSSANRPENGLLRTLQVAERAGVDREGELVRVPIFFHEGECPAVKNLVLTDESAPGSGPSIPFQADDVRRGPDGGISRMHLWFAVNLKAGEKRRYRLSQGSGSMAAPNAMSLRRSEEGGLTVQTDQGAITVSKDGGLQSMKVTGGSWEFSEPAEPSVLISYPAGPAGDATEVTLNRRTDARVVEWSAGVLFSKIRTVLSAANGASLEQEFRIPQHGREIVVTTALFPGERVGAVVKQNRLLEGSVEGWNAGEAGVRHIPAGVRFALRAEHAYSVTGLVKPDRTGSLLAVPLVLGGTNGVWSSEKAGTVILEGNRDLQKGAEGEAKTLYGYWTEVRLVPVAAVGDDSLWQAYRSHVQPLVAVVDEPEITVETLHATLRDVVREMKPIGWRQEAGRAEVLEERERATRLLQHVPAARESDVEGLVAGAKNAENTITKNGQRKIREDEKGRAYGGLDPYHITYTQSAAAALVKLEDAPANISAVNLAMARGVRQVGGRVDGMGYPYIDCFNRTFNMQLGPVLFGLTAGPDAHDDSLVRFYRELATTPLVKGVFGRGQRPYTGGPTTSADATDYLYQSICDFWLRATELLAHENLDLHPLAYSRYTDCIDVVADRYHGASAKPKESETTEVRANFFRGQSHTHRWLGWSCSPFIRLLEDPAEHSQIGLTEAVAYARAQEGRWKNWPDLTFYILADLLVRSGLPGYVAPALPPSPKNVVVKPEPDGESVEISWQTAPGAAAYRIYRTDTPGGPYRWLNSPYVTSPTPALTVEHYADAGVKVATEYVVTSVDDAGRESPWPDDAVGFARATH